MAIDLYFFIYFLNIQHVIFIVFFKIYAILNNHIAFAQIFDIIVELTNLNCNSLLSG